MPDLSTLEVNQKETIDLNFATADLPLAEKRSEQELDLADGDIDETGFSDYGDPDEIETEIDKEYLNLPWEPTNAEPGSEEKIRVLASRYHNGFPLWHEEDNNRLEESNREEQGLSPKRSSRWEDDSIEEAEAAHRWVAKRTKQLKAAAPPRAESCAQSNEEEKEVRLDMVAMPLIERAPKIVKPKTRRSVERSVVRVVENRRPTERNFSSVKPELIVSPPATAESIYKVATSNPDQLRQEYEMLSKAVNFGMAKSDLDRFVTHNKQALLDIGVNLPETSDTLPTFLKL